MTTSIMQSIPIIRAATSIRAATVRERSPFAERGAAFAGGPLAALVRRRLGLAILLVCILVSAAGCSKGRAYRLGHDAEQRGETHVAYAYYCQAAVRRPDNGTISTSIRRLTPAAATYWRQHAREAASQGRYADAWRMAMRCLRVQPDDTDATALVRELESDHSAAVAPARQAYERRGPRTLAIALGESHAETTSEALASDSPDDDEDALPISAVAGDGQDAGTTSAVDLQTLADDTKIGQERGDALAPLDRNDRTRPPLDRADRMGLPLVRDDPIRPPQDRDNRTRPPVDRDNRARPPLDRDTRTRPPRNGPDLTRPRPGRDERVRPPLDQAARVQPLAGKLKPDAVIALTLSRRDERYPRRISTGNGLSIRLRDTDKDPDADLDIYANDKRIRKIRNMEPGQSETFTTPSGAAYSLSLLSVNHATRTVRIAIKPA